MSLIKNSSWNIFGLALPLLMAIPVMGILARLLGVERFGLLLSHMPLWAMRVFLMAVYQEL